MTTTALIQQPSSTHPDYVGLVKFLLTPFLESPNSLKVDCEVLPSRMRVLLRVAFDGEDKGRVFGRGGRNIQAVRTVLQAIAQTSGYTLYLEVFGGQPSERDGDQSERPPVRRAGGDRGAPRRPRPRS